MQSSKYSKSVIVVPKLKDKYGPIMTSLLMNDIEVTTVEKLGTRFVGLRQNKSYEKAIWFNSTPPPQLSCKVGWWMCDLRDPRIFPRVKVDTIFLCNKQFLKDYERHFGAKVYYMSQTGYDIPIEKGRDITWDVVFIGERNHFYHKNRAQYLEELAKFNFKHISGEKTTVDQKWIYNMTPISIAISPQMEGYTSNRLYNILSSGGFCLTLWFPGIEDLFENKKHLVWFKSPEEMKELIEYYLKHPKKRDKIAKAGKKLYDEKHSGKCRLYSMLNLLN